MNAETAKQLQTYIKAYDANDFDTMASMLEAAETNTVLEHWIWLHSIENADDVQITPEQHANIQRIVEQHKKGQ